MPEVLFFQGQGLVSKGIGVAGIDPLVSKRLFERASDISHLPLRRIAEEGSPEMSRADVSQLLASIQGLGYCQTYYHDIAHFSAVAGHSSGEITAIGAAGMIEEEKFFDLLWPRAEEMHFDACKNKGAMLAVINKTGGVDANVLTDVCRRLNLALANKNSPKQFVVSGEAKKIQEAKIDLEGRGYICIPLKVEGAFHSPLVNGTADRLRELIPSLRFKNPKIPVYSNVLRQPITDWRVLAGLISIQAITPVFWLEICVALIEAGIISTEQVKEAAERKVLTGFYQDTLEWYKATFPEKFAALARNA